MNVRVESMSHGDGKIYLQMVIERLHSGAAVLMEARLKDGQRIPAHLLPFRPREATSNANYVVVLPHFQVREVDLSFVEYSDESTPLSQSRLTVELGSVRWITRLNALVRNELIEQMLDIEREYCADRMNLYFTDAILDGDEIVVKMLVDMPHVEGSDVMVEFFDLQGQDLELPVYPLVDEVAPAQRFGEADRLHVGFSVRVRNEAKEFCVTAYDGAELVSGGFAVFCDDTYEPLRLAFASMATDASRDGRYGAWYAEHCETLAGLAVQRQAHLDFEPEVSLVIPVRAGDECYLPACLRALRQQTYSHFQVLVVDAGVSGEAFERAVREWEGDSRLSHIVHDEDADDASLRLTGLLQSEGQACAVLEPAVILAPEALFEYVRCVNQVRSARLEKELAAKGVGHPGTEDPACPDESGLGGCDVVYANHDLYRRGTGFFCPSFKPAYSPDLLYSYDYMGPVVFFSRSVINDVAQDCGFASEAFDYDLELKACARAVEVCRIDQVLYHVQDAASISSAAEKALARRTEETFRGGRKAVASQLRRMQVDAVVLSEVSDRRYRVQYRLPSPHPSLSIIIPSKDQVNLLDSCIASVIENNHGCDFEIVVVDNGSVQAETLAYYHELTRVHPQVRIVPFEGPFNQGAMINAGAATCGSEYLLLLDNDTEMIGSESVSALLAHCCRGDVGVVGARLLYPDDTVQHAGMTVGAYGSAANIGVNLPRSAHGYARRLVCSQNFTCVSGAAMMVKRAVFDAVGGFDERFLVSCYDVDFCCKVRHEGYLVAYNADVELYHQENATTGHVLTPSQRLRAERERAFLHYRWPRYFVEGDPYMSVGFDRDAPYYLLGV